MPAFLPVSASRSTEKRPLRAAVGVAPRVNAYLPACSPIMVTFVVSASQVSNLPVREGERSGQQRFEPRRKLSQLVPAEVQRAFVLSVVPRPLCTQSADGRASVERPAGASDSPLGQCAGVPRGYFSADCQAGV